MANLRRLSMKLVRGPVMWEHRVALGNLKLAYIITADKLFRYPKGRSRIVYIGTTEKGTARIAQSVAFRADSVLALRGVLELSVRVVTCTPRRNVETWKKLEMALILAFKEVYGDVPWCNTQGKNKKWYDELKYFSLQRLKTILDEVR